jgi:hypothetical protein
MGLRHISLPMIRASVQKTARRDERYGEFHCYAAKDEQGSVIVSLTDRRCFEQRAGERVKPGQDQRGAQSNKKPAGCTG